MPEPDPLQEYLAARTTADQDAMTAAALRLAAVGQQFGTHPGRVPTLLHEAYHQAPPPGRLPTLLPEAYPQATGTGRTRLAVALARSWVYGGHPDRAVPFAAEA